MMNRFCSDDELLQGLFLFNSYDFQTKLPCLYSFVLMIKGESFK